MPAAPAAPKPTKIPKNWRALFLAALGETSNVAAAARAAGISLSHVYRLRRDNPDFKSRWMAALCEGYDNLEMDLLCWLRTGKVESITEQNENSKTSEAAPDVSADRLESDGKPPATDKSAEPDKPRKPPLPPPERKFDAATALRVLAAHREAVGRERGRQAMEDEGSLIAAINRKIDAMQARDKAARRLARKRRAQARPSRAV